MGVSMWPVVVDALVTGMRATSGYRAPTTASASIPVYDGQELMVTAEVPVSWLVIGWSGDPDSPDQQGQAGQAAAAMATTRPREELGEISCQAVCQGGRGDLSGSAKGARDGAFAVLADVERFLRADPTLGIPIGAAGQVLWAQITSLTPTQFSDGGHVCAVAFAVSYRARI